MSIHLQRDLKSMEQDLLDQSAMVERMVYRSCQALRQRDGGIVEEVLANEEIVNIRDVQIEEECLKILALHQPVAIDLRRVATVLKINSDLERMADLAVNVGERALKLVTFPEFQLPSGLDRMAEVAISMVRDALDAFVRQDLALAREVCRRDDVVDDLNRQVIDDLQAMISHDSTGVEPALQFFSAARHVERIGDHATNIAEDVIYLVDGEIARHGHDHATDVLPTDD
jgi:phosphate transport system protein